MHNKSKSNPVLIGLLLIILGVVFLSDSFHFIRFGHLMSHWWPLILIGIGLFKLNKRDGGGGIALIIIGSLFLLSELNIVSWHQISRFWPLALIIAGIAMLLKRKTPIMDNGIDFTGISEMDIEINTIFSSTHKQLTSQQFRGGEINAIFGNIKLDLRSVKLSPEGASLTADAIFGSITIFISPGMALEIHSSEFLGSVENQATSAQTGPRLKIKADAVFGNIRISN